jgi:hypothetical protein
MTRATATSATAARTGRSARGYPGPTGTPGVRPAKPTHRKRLVDALIDHRRRHTVPRRPQRPAGTVGRLMLGALDDPILAAAGDHR